MLYRFNKLSKTAALEKEWLIVTSRLQDAAFLTGCEFEKSIVNENIVKIKIDFIFLFFTKQPPLHAPFQI